MTPPLTSDRTPVRGTGTAKTRFRGALALATITPLLLLGCAVEEGPSAEASPSPESSATETPEAQQPTDSDSVTGEEVDGDTNDLPTGQGPGGDLPDPEEMDLERTEELGAYFSEEEACMSVGSMLDGLQEDMNSGVTEQDVLDDIYLAVEQNYILAPAELREHFENILALLDTDVGSLEEEEVMVAAEPVDGWLTVGFCEGEYHNQTSGNDA